MFRCNVLLDLSFITYFPPTVRLRNFSFILHHPCLSTFCFFMSGRAGFEPLVVREGKSFMLFPEVETGCAAYYRALPCNDSCVARFTRHHNVSKGDGGDLIVHLQSLLLPLSIAHLFLSVHDASEVRRRWSSFNCPSAIIVTASIYRSSTPKCACIIALICCQMLRIRSAL